jgi:hypothetical protein
VNESMRMTYEVREAASTHRTLISQSTEPGSKS